MAQNNTEEVIGKTTTVISNKTMKSELGLTAIFQGQDQQLGGCPRGGDDDFFDEADDPFPERYWFTPDKIETLRALHDYVDSLPRSGKVLSLSSLERVARGFNDGQPLV